MLSPLKSPEVKVTGSTLTEAILPHPVVVAPDTPLVEVIAGMSQAQFSVCQIATNGQTPQSHIASESCALVMAEGKVLGICTERDLVRLAARGQSPRGLTVDQVMTTPVITRTVDQMTNVFATLHFMQQHHIRHLPILGHQGELLGLVTPQSLRQLLKLLDMLRLRQISEVMQPQVVQATPTTSVLDIARLMADQRVSCVVVVEPTAAAVVKPIGIITERDIVQFQCLELNLAILLAQTVMSAPICCLQIQDSLWNAHQLMQEKRIRRLVITDAEGNLAGLITQTSMLNIFSSGEIYETVDILQQRISELETEKLDLLRSRNLRLEEQVAQRTIELQDRADREQFLAAFSRQISQSLDLSIMLASAVDEVKRFLACDRVVIYQFEDALQGTVVAEAVEPQWGTTLGSHYQDMCFPHWLESDYMDGRQRIVDDIYQANLSDCHIEFLESLQIKGYLIVPVIISHQLWGLLAAHQCGESSPWQCPNLDLLDRLSTQLAIAIQQSQLYQQAHVEIGERQLTEQALQTLNQDLEARVEARTRALQLSQDQLQRSEEMLRLTIDNAPIGIATSALDGQILTVNQAFCRMLGYTAEEIMQMSWLELTHPDDRITSAHWDEQLHRGEIDSFQVEKRYLHKDGRAVESVLRIGLVRDTQGHPVRVVAEVEDIGERKKAEAERHRLTNILEASLNEIYIFNASTLQFEYVNQSALDNLGYSLETLRTMTPWDIKTEISRADFTELLTPLNRHQQEIIQFKTTHQRADGSRYPIEVRLQLIERDQDRVYLSVVLDITEQRQVEETLSRHMTAIESSIDGIAILYNDCYVYLNSAHAKLFGYDNGAELLGKSWTRLYPDAELRRFEQEVFPIMAQQGHWQGEAMARRKDGSTFDEEVSLTVTADGYLICVCRDIGERKRADLALRDSKEQLQDFFDNASDLIQSVSMQDGRFVFVNQAWLNTLGYSAEEIQTLTIFDVLIPDCQEHCQQLFQLLLRGDCAAMDHVEIGLRTKSGAAIQLEGSINCRVEHGVPVATQGIFRNVTERQRAEQAMKQQLAAIEAASDGIAILDSQGCYIFVNTAHCQLFNLESPNELLGKTWRSLYSATEIERFDQEILPYLQHHYHWRGEAIATRQDGSTFPQGISLTQIDGVGLVCVCQDISDRKRAEAESKQAEEEIRRALETERDLNDLKSRFVSMTSHEFRTPLGVIASSAGIIQDYGDRLDAAKQQKHLTRIQDSVIHMTQLLEDVLTLSRVEAGKLQLKLMSTSIPAFCQEIIEELNTSDGNPRIEMQVDATFPDMLVVDQRLMRQILNNLLSNALKYSFPSSDVSLRLARQPNSFEIVIQDQGIGIPPEDLKHLFQSFYRAKNVGNIPGTGLGLSIVKKLVELQQGKIICQSEVDVGTTFILRFPLRLDDDQRRLSGPIPEDLAIADDASESAI